MLKKVAQSLLPEEAMIDVEIILPICVFFSVFNFVLSSCLKVHFGRPLQSKMD